MTRCRRYPAAESWDRRLVAADAIIARAASSRRCRGRFAGADRWNPPVDDKSRVVCSGRWEIARGNFGRASSAANAPSGLLVLSIQWFS
jgi:hypothetical protein